MIYGASQVIAIPSSPLNIMTLTPGTLYNFGKARYSIVFAISYNMRARTVNTVSVNEHGNVCLSRWDRTELW